MFARMCKLARDFLLRREPRHLFLNTTILTATLRYPTMASLGDLFGSCDNLFATSATSAAPITHARTPLGFGLSCATTAVPSASSLFQSRQ
jgi:hypothetical protein